MSQVFANAMINLVGSASISYWVAKAVFTKLMASSGKILPRKSNLASLVLKQTNLFEHVSQFIPVEDAQKLDDLIEYAKRDLER